LHWPNGRPELSLTVIIRLALRCATRKNTAIAALTKDGGPEAAVPDHHRIYFNRNHQFLLWGDRSPQLHVKALVKKTRDIGLWLEEVPEPEIGINDVLIQVLRTGICGTDVHIYNWDNWAQRTIPVPMVVGHEFVGRIVEVGANVHDFHAGDIVSGEGHVVCGRCRNCLAGRRHLCKDTKGIGVNRPGAFAEYLALPQTNVWVHESSREPEHHTISRDVQAIFDPFGNAVHTALSFDVLGEDVLITGAGPIGVMAAAVARHAGARFVVVTDVNPFRLELAKKMGATLAIDVRSESIADAQQRLGMKEGFDIGLEMSGNAAAFRDMLANMCHGGKIAMLGIPEKEIAIDWNTVVFNMLTIKGIYGREMYETWYKMTVMLQSGLDISPVITHRFHFTEFQQGFDVMRSGQSGKVILTWHDEECPRYAEH
jgi:threonine 3-dehydrogenase